MEHLAVKGFKDPLEPRVLKARQVRLFFSSTRRSMASLDLLDRQEWLALRGQLDQLERRVLKGL